MENPVTDTKLGKGQDGVVTEVRFWGTKSISGRDEERDRAKETEKRHYLFIHLTNI